MRRVQIVVLLLATSLAFVIPTVRRQVELNTYDVAHSK